MSLSSLLERQRCVPNPCRRVPRSPTSLSKGDAVMTSQEGLFPERAARSKDDHGGTHDLHARIASQLELYLSDHYLARDAFLLKHVQKNRMGYVSLKLLTSFKKMKELTRDWLTTLAAARRSPRLEVNWEATKVRRREPLPDWLQCAPTSRLLLAWNLSGESPGAEEALPGAEPEVEQQPGLLETALRLLGAHGGVSSLRLLRPGGEPPAELGRRRLALPGRRGCAVVEFERLEGARRAYAALGGAAGERLSEGGGVCVVPLGNPCVRRHRHSHDREGAGEEELPEEGMMASRGTPRQKAKGPLCSARGPPLQKSSGYGSMAGSPRLARRVQRRRRSSDGPLGSPRDESGGQRPAGGSRRSLCSGDHAQESASSPWVQRRKAAAQAARPDATLRVLRQPRGPDGTKGFCGNGGRGG